MTARVMVVACVLVAWGPSARGQAAEVGETRVYECMRVAQPPVIDGQLNDACWQQATKTGQFVRILKGPAEIQQTLFQVLYDDAHLYLGVTCLEPKPEGILAAVRSNDTSSVMGDDAIEIFLRPDLNEPDYYQFAANSVGTRYDGKAFESSWNAEWVAAGSVGEEAWHLECAVSLASLGRFAVPGAMWGFNVNRDRQAGGDTEWSGWSDTMGGFHTPERFGSLIFGGEAGGVDRALIIECARHARQSIELEARINEYVRTIREEGLEYLQPAEREKVEPTVAAAEEGLQGLQDLLGGDAPLDLEAWRRVTARLRAVAEDVDEMAWIIKFAKLLADD